MDEIVKAALRKWPNVPHCWGWLALDARGDWYMRDERIQAAGPFPKVKGSRIEHDKLREFIHRNYACDDSGCWYFQNGPQRVYVELEAAPWVWRVQVLAPEASSAASAGRAARSNTPMVSVQSHTGSDAEVHEVWLDEHGRLFLLTDIGAGIVHSLDMHAAAQALEAGAWPVSPAGLQECRFEEMPARWGYCLSPQQLHGGGP